MQDKANYSAGVDAGAINLINGSGGRAAQALAGNPGVALVSLTGATKSGMETMKTASSNLTHLLLELGGNDAFILDRDGDVDLFDILAINKFRLSKKVDLEKYPTMSNLNDIGVFNEKEMTSVDNGVALARKEYNTYAFRYNQVASGFPMQYLVKLFGFKTHYVIFGNPKSTSYHTNYETLDSDDESNSLSSLNRVKKDVETGSKEQENKIEELQDIQIEHSDVILKPTQNLTNLGEKNNANQDD